MSEDAGVAQARLLLSALYDQLADISRKLEKSEMRGLSTSARGALHDRREHAQLRREFYEVHHLIDGLHQRFPQTRPHRRPADRLRAASAGHRV